MRGVGLVVVGVVVAVLLLRAGDGSEADETVRTEDRGGGAAVEPDDTSQPTGSPLPVAEAHDPSQVKVLVLNGASVQGAARRVSEMLTSENYVTARPGDARPVDVTTVYFLAGYEGDAKAIADLLADPAPRTAPMPTPPPTTALGDAKVLVVLAADVATRPR